MAFPTTLPSYTITSGAESPNTAAGGLGLSGLLNAFEVDVTALGTKMGTGASTPLANTILYGTGIGTSAWQGLTSAQLASIISDETGTGSLVFANSPTIVTPTIASFANANHDHSNSAGGGVLTHTALPVGSVLQVVSTNYTAVATGTTIIPYDDTIPQITEGTEFITQTITPKSVTNRLSVEVNFSCDASTTSDTIIALFQDATAAALAANSTYTTTANGESLLTLRYDMLASTTSPTTFRVRGGLSVAGTFTFNGFGGTRRFGGITLSNIRVTEYKA